MFMWNGGKSFHAQTIACICATVSSNETDTNTANNTATQITTVKAATLQKVLLAEQVLTGGCESTTGNVYLTGPAPRAA